jgi:hypothetical protein
MRPQFKTEPLQLVACFTRKSADLHLGFISSNELQKCPYTEPSNSFWQGQSCAWAQKIQFTYTALVSTSDILVLE